MKRVRIYHPDYRVSWQDRFWDLFSGHRPASRPDGVDYTLMNRSAARNIRELLEGVLNVSLLGDEMVRVDTSWRLPEEADARQTAAEDLVRRLRFGQMHPGALRVTIPARWLQFDDAPHGTRILVRLLECPNPGLRTFLAGNLAEDGPDEWTEYAVHGD